MQGVHGSLSITWARHALVILTNHITAFQAVNYVVYHFVMDQFQAFIHSGQNSYLD